MPLVRQWGVLDLEGLDAEGERARTELADALHALDAQASRFVEPRGRGRGQEGGPFRGVTAPQPAEADESWMVLRRPSTCHPVRWARGGGLAMTRTLSAFGAIRPASPRLPRERRGRRLEGVELDPGCVEYDVAGEVDGGPLAAREVFGLVPLDG
jgi:hypothetical protein